MLKVEIDAQQVQSVQTRRGNKNGRDWAMTSQPVWLFKPNQKFPMEIVLTLPDGVSHYDVGLYQLDVESALDQGNFKSLVIDSRALLLVSLDKQGK